MRRKTKEEFLNELFERNSYYKNGEFEVVGDYLGGKVPIECKCPIHGNWFSAPQNMVRQNSRCPKCSGKYKKTTSDFIRDLEIKNTHYRNGEFKVVGEYIDNKTPIACECPIHGIWDSTLPTNLLVHNYGCPRCSKSGKIFNQEHFLTLLFDNNEHYRNGEFEVIGEFVDSSKHIKCRCKIHGEWDTTSASHLLYRNANCPKCSNRYQITQEEFLEKLKLKNEHYRNGEFKVISVYSSRSKAMECMCPIHNVWKTSASSLLLGSGCPKCMAAGTSYAENYIRCALKQALPQIDIPDKGDRKLLKGKEIDIPVYDAGFAIEYGSWYWHKNKWKEDKNKQDILKENNITLFTIYDGYDGSVVFPEDFNLMVYNYDLGEEKGWKTLKKIVNFVLRDTVCNEIDWSEVERQALLLSRARDTEKFSRELRKRNEHYKNGEFIITGSYIGANVPIECTCKRHGVWKTTTPNKLLQGRTCPKCSREDQTEQQRYTTKEFIEKLKGVNPLFASGKYRVVGKYVDSRTPIACECSVHGIWDTSIPTSLLQKHGCPKCGIENNIQSQRRIDQKEFLKRLYEKNEKYRNNEFEVVGEYQGYHVPIACKCPIHGIWETSTPANMLRRNQGCPYCYRRGYKK